jgi:hypothetical protein
MNAVLGVYAANSGILADQIGNGSVSASGNYFSTYSGGTLGGYLKTVTGQEINLGSGLTASQNLYQVAIPYAAAGVISQVSGIDIFTSSIGVTTINTASAAPIPPSILLMGTGLLGLIGVGRKKLFG